MTRRWKVYSDHLFQPVPQGSTTNELRAFARRQYNYFKYGTTTPSGTILAKVEDGIKGAFNWVAQQFDLGSTAAQQKVAEVEDELAKAKAEAQAEAKAKAEQVKQEL